MKPTPNDGSFEESLSKDLKPISINEDSEDVKDIN